MYTILCIEISCVLLNIPKDVVKDHWRWFVKIRACWKRGANALGIEVYFGIERGIQLLGKG